jgi:hypothetical protein
VVSSTALGLLLCAAMFTDLQMLLFTVLWVVLLVGATAWAERRLEPRALAAIAGAALVAAVPFVTIFYPAFARAPEAGYGTPSLTDISVYAYRWWDYFTPAVIPRALGGYELAILAVVAAGSARRDRRVRIWLLGAGVLLLLALGPYLKPSKLPLPFAALSAWGPLGQFRTPYRLAIPAVIGLCAAAALVLDRVLPRMSARGVQAMVASLLLLRVGLALWQHPLSTQTYPSYETYRRLAGDPRASALIEVPFGVRSGFERIGSGGEILQFYQHEHRKPLVNAMVARLPDAVFDFYRAHPSLPFLAGERIQASADVIAQDLDEVIAMTGASHLLVHRGMMDVQTGHAIERTLDAHQRLRRLGVERDLVIYGVVPAP